MENYTYNSLSGLVGDKVQLQDGQGNVAELSIFEVIKGRLDGEEWEAFSVIYQGERGMSIPQGTYQFSHEKFGEHQLFLSPNSETEYETVVTRKRSK